MRYTPSTIWKSLPDDVSQYFSSIFPSQTTHINPAHLTSVFFRADDIGVPSRSFNRLIDLFIRFQIPLALAVVPTWITRKRWEHLRSLANKQQDLFCWHQHGWRHANHESKGKKQEFGPSRKVDALQADLVRGRNRLEKTLGDAFVPLFTPPWNRCDKRTLNLLKDLNYIGVSMSKENNRDVPVDLLDISVGVDLHTRKEKNGRHGWALLSKEFHTCLLNDQCGIMIHHQRMNHNAFYFLELLLKWLKTCERVRIVNLRYPDQSI